MKYFQFTGDLIAAFVDKEIDVIVHQVNCFNVAKSGIAPKIFETLPWLAEAYFGSKVEEPSKRMGRALGVKHDDQWGFNLYGQYHHDHDQPSYMTNYDALSNALKSMQRTLLAEYGKTEITIGFPLIGCGQAGGDWQTVESMILAIFANTNYNLVLYRLPNEGDTTVTDTLSVEPVCCNACQVRGKTWKGDDPNCAFTSGVFDGENNWKCATVGLVRDLCIRETYGVSYYCEADQNYATISTIEVSFPEALDAQGYRVPTPVCLWVGWYKDRGRTEGMWLLFENLPPRAPTEEECLIILNHYAD